jgi:probable rRNA maturation factor
MEDKFSIVNLIKMKIPKLALPTGRQAFVIIKNDILGKKYFLSLAFIDEKKMREINKTYRKKDESTNILSFSLSKTEGEILVCPAVIKRETKKFNKNFRELLGFLVIHGMLHLKGMEHSSRMEREETKYDKKYFRRN